MRYLILAFLSGIPALIYEVAWTRQVALAIGSQVEAISLVLVAFFGGLALGSRVLGRRVDRSARPLRVYAVLEIAAGSLALVSPAVLRALGAAPFVELPDPARLALAGLVLLPISFLLGGTQPALLCCQVRGLRLAGRGAGSVVGANTVGSVVGVMLAGMLVPRVGLRATVWGAGLAAVVVGCVALALAAPEYRAAPHAAAKRRDVPVWLLVAAAGAGVATLAYEVLVARAASLRIGSSLFGWVSVLALFLMGLALGNLATARRASAGAHPARDLGWLQLGSAALLGTCLAQLAPSPAESSSGFGWPELTRVALGVLPPGLLAGAAFPLMVRLGVRRRDALGGGFGAVAAANTAGGIAGSLLASFALLPLLGPVGGALACASLNACIGIALLLRSAPTLRRSVALAAALLLVVGLSRAALEQAPLPEGARLLALEHGRQASAAVVRNGRRRDLLVDGDPEASTVGNARRTEELLAALPLLLHPDPRDFLEVGFGAGITLASAARFPLARIECVEIAQSVLTLARFFTPDNEPAGSGTDPRLRVIHADGRAWLARGAGSYDVIVANTLHPWSLGATGLYSHEYFERIAAALRPGGIAAQWLPLDRVGADGLGTILRTMLAVFPSGSVWWGAENLLVVAGAEPDLATLGARFDRPEVRVALRPLEIPDVESLWMRRVASFDAARRALGPGPVLVDDLPALEVMASRRGSTGGERTELAVVARLAEAGTEDGSGSGVLQLWVESLRARAAGDHARAQARAELALAAGFAPARTELQHRALAAARQAADNGHEREAEAVLREYLEGSPSGREARFALAALLRERGDTERAAAELETLLEHHPDDAQAWNLLGVVRGARQDPRGADEAFTRALRADPFFPEALGNAGLLAARRGDRARAREMLGRLREISPLGVSPEETALLEALSAR